MSLKHWEEMILEIPMKKTRRQTCSYSPPLPIVLENFLWGSFQKMLINHITLEALREILDTLGGIQWNNYVSRMTSICVTRLPFLISHCTHWLQRFGEPLENICGVWRKKRTESSIVWVDVVLLAQSPS